MTDVAAFFSRLGLSSRAILGLVVLVATFGAFIWVASGSFYRTIQDVAHGSGRTVKVVFPNAQQLQDAGFMRGGSEVRVGGVSVGHVEQIALDPGARTATATLSVNDSTGPIYANARAALRWQTLLGANFYVALDRGTPNAGPLGSRPIPPSQTTDQVELEDITSVLQGGARTGLQTLPKEVATALSDPHPLARTLSTLAGVAPDVATGLNAVRGEQPQSDLQALVSATGTAVHALDTRTELLREVVAGAAATLGTTAARQADLQSTIAQAPASLDSTEVTLRQLDGTLTLLDPLITTLQGPAPEVAPTLAALRPTVLNASALLNHAVPLLRSLRPAAASLARTAQLGLPLLQQLTPSLDRLGGQILPYLGEKDPSTQHSTAEMIGPALAVYANSGGLVDDLGRSIRFPLSLGNSNFYLPCQTYINNPDKNQLIACQTLQQALQSLFTYNPLGRVPGTAPPPANAKATGR